MSRRHREGRDPSRVAKDDRAAAHRHDRRKARQVIEVADDGEPVFDDSPGHLHSHRPTRREPSRVRHWKLPFWKRRRAGWKEQARAARDPDMAPPSGTESGPAGQAEAAGRSAG
jgi:hypothetical protein